MAAGRADDPGQPCVGEFVTTWGRTMPISEIICYLCVGFVLLALLNLLLELLGISIFGGERKPGFLIRLILMILLSFGIGYGYKNYLIEMPEYQAFKEKIHGSMGDEYGEDEALDEDSGPVELDSDVEEEVMEEVDEAIDEAIDEAMDEAIDEAIDEAMDEPIEDEMNAVDEAMDVAEEEMDEAIDAAMDDAADTMMDEAEEAAEEIMEDATE